MKDLTEERDMSGDMVLCLFVGGLSFLIFDDLMAGVMGFAATAIVLWAFNAIEED